MIKKVALISMILFATAGAFFLGIALHEFSHYLDFKDYVQDDEICFLNVGGKSIGYYKFDFDNRFAEEVNQKEKFTEFKAYTISAIVLIIFLVSYFIFLDDYTERKMEADLR